MSIPPEWLAPYLASNLLALALLAAALWRPSVARWGFVALFGIAAGVNAVTALRAPEAYAGYAEVAWGPYPAFIRGWFADHVGLVILPIAAGQLAVAILIALGGGALRLGAIGAVVFLVAIAPLGIGAAFPMTLIAAVAAAVLARRLGHAHEARHHLRRARAW